MRSALFRDITDYSLPTFRDDLSVPSSRVKKSKKKARQGITTIRSVITQKSADLTCFAAEA
jgi:hypothetical protein